MTAVLWALAGTQIAGRHRRRREPGDHQSTHLPIPVPWQRPGHPCRRRVGHSHLPPGASLRARSAPTWTAWTQQRMTPWHMVTHDMPTSVRLPDAAGELGRCERSVAACRHRRARRDSSLPAEHGWRADLPERAML